MRIKLIAMGIGIVPIERLVMKAVTAGVKYPFEKNEQQSVSRLKPRCECYPERITPS